jgi:hypothetical protein
MEPVREAWTDERLDDLNHRVDEGFGETRAEFREVRTEIRELRSEMNARFDAMQRTMIYGFVSLSAAMLAGFGGIATQL